MGVAVDVAFDAITEGADTEETIVELAQHGIDVLDAWIEYKKCKAIWH